MDALFEVDDRDVLGGWVGQRRRRRVTEKTAAGAYGARFAFYGRTSTAEFQDPVTSRAWQREMAETVIAGRGAVVAEFFDVGCSRRVPWEQRGEAAALLEQAQSADRRFDAVVVGEYERAFAALQFEHVAGVLRRSGISVWLPEAGGPVRPDDPEHRALLTVLAAQAQREVVRARHRTLAAMAAQTVEQGRSWAVDRPTGTGWWTLVRIRIGHMRVGVGVVTGWIRTR